VTLAMLLRPLGPDLELEGLLPAWVIVGRYVIQPILAFALTWGLARIEIAIRSRGIDDLSNEPWHERARGLWPLRHAPIASCLAIVGAAVSILGWRFGAGSADFTRLLAVNALATYAAYLLERFRVSQRFAPWMGPRAYLRGRLTLVLVLASAPLTLVALVFPLGPRPTSLTLVGSAALLFFMAGGGLVLVRSVGLVRAARPPVRELVDVCATEVGVRVRGVLEIDFATANALAFPVPGILAVTPRALEVLDERELRAVVLHELGHLRERWKLILPRLALATIAIFAVIQLHAGRSFGPALLLLILALAVLLRVSSRRAEKRADAFAARGEAGADLARALARLHEANLVPAVLVASTHPSLYDRMIAAGVTPDFPRPRAPSRLPSLVAFATIFVLATAGTVLTILAVGEVGERRDDRSAVILSLALFGPDPYKVADLALIEYADGDLAGSERLLRAATRLEPESPWWHADHALVLAQLGHCEEARSGLARAEDLAPSWKTDVDLLEVALQNARDAVAACEPR
jgi:Zn-dependent protease with chaperone function